MLKNNRMKLWFLLPAVVWVLVFTIFPFFYGLRTSFFNTVPGKEDEFIGVGNFIRFFNDEDAIYSLVITVIFVIISVFAELVIGMIIAVLFNRPMPAKNFFRSIMIIPLFITPIGAGLIFYTMFYEEGGLINSLIFLKVPWLSDPYIALISVIIVDIWQWTPFFFLIFLVALQSIPQDIYESAYLDTKNGWYIFKFITLPIIQPTIILVLLIRLTEAFKVFDIPFTLTTGGPGKATQVLSMYAYRSGMRFFDFGYASSTSFILFILVLIIVSFLFKRMKQIYQ